MTTREELLKEIKDLHTRTHQPDVLTYLGKQQDDTVGAEHFFQGSVIATMINMEEDTIENLKQNASLPELKEYKKDLEKRLNQIDKINKGEQICF